MKLEWTDHLCVAGVRDLKGKQEHSQQRTRDHGKLCDTDTQASLSEQMSVLLEECWEREEWDGEEEEDTDRNDWFYREFILVLSSAFKGRVLKVSPYCDRVPLAVVDRRVRYDGRRLGTEDRETEAEFTIQDEKFEKVTKSLIVEEFRYTVIDAPGCPLLKTMRTKCVI
ncbi:hypothetical protein EYF80_029938 [Liparis tanakae]|uniref:Uncharacterized protein n=1 Tax=Liparis tanakae TaxID=230148 RepID=A0A4Z2H4K5_9TELE|nr:hypothetical protein EYF80_029938 [Liparis tanakae]